MKKMVLSLVTLMVLGTSTSFGKTNGQPRENNNKPNMEMVQGSHNNNQKDNGRGQQMNGRTLECKPVNHKPEPKPEPMHHNEVSKGVTTGIVVGTVLGTLISSLVK